MCLGIGFPRNRKRREEGAVGVSIFHLAERAVEDEGVLAAGGLHELRQARREAAAGEVVRPRDVSLVAPLLIPSDFPKSTKDSEKKLAPKSARRRRRVKAGGRT
jgi:hypothetical protein